MLPPRQPLRSPFSDVLRFIFTFIYYFGIISIIKKIGKAPSIPQREDGFLMKRFFAVSLLMLLLFLLLPSGPALAGRSFQIDWAESLGNGYVVANFSDSAKSSQYFGRYLRKESDSFQADLVNGYEGGCMPTDTKGQYLFDELVSGADYWLWMEDRGGNRSNVVAYYGDQAMVNDSSKRVPQLFSLTLIEIDERSYSDTIYEAMVPAFDGSKILAHMDSDMSFKLQFDLNLYDTRISSDDVAQIFLYTPNGWERPLVSCSYYMFSNSYHRCCIGGSFDEMEYVLGEAVHGTYTVVMYWNGKLVGSNSFQVN